ncbi:hypothetical protein ADUPG1_000483 [Aduncisulcus paluster]|uniref:EF-hand domain-containing protein n=1 Tax=Aduncisulcus paluster TaxID=2918883 RepID=A0ABQ5KAH0_9EUKA|nr:hypothetical protein ADUPG1_000483 [Aduncisulcus paluster]
MQPDIEVMEYIEPEATTKKLWKLFDLNKRNYFTKTELKTIFKSLGLYPSLQELTDIILEAKQKPTLESSDSPKRSIPIGVKMRYREFRAMRERGDITTLNVIAEFKKYDVDMITRGFLTKRSIRRVLEEEGAPKPYIEGKVKEVELIDDDRDGVISFKEFHDYLKHTTPQSWLDWVYENVSRGIPSDEIMRIMLENGFEDREAREILLLTKREGRLAQEKTFLDKAKLYAIFPK